MGLKCISPATAFGKAYKVGQSVDVSEIAERLDQDEEWVVRKMTRPWRMRAGKLIRCFAEAGEGGAAEATASTDGEPDGSPDESEPDAVEETENENDDADDGDDGGENDEDAVEETEDDDGEAAAPPEGLWDDDAWPHHRGAGVWELPDGEKIKGKQEAIDYLTALREKWPQTETED